MKLVVASYNILHGKLSGYDMEKLTESIRICGADIVGIQEADVGATRSGGIDIPALMGEALGFSSRFARAIPLQGGAYGTAILSRFPILDFTVVPLSSGDLEARSIGRAVIDVRGERIHFWNTHVSYENTKQREIQLSEIAGMMKAEKNVILTGDFNTDHFDELEKMGEVRPVNCRENYMGSFRETARAIDNIVLTGKWKVEKSGMIENDHSDHNLIYAVISDEM